MSALTNGLYVKKPDGKSTETSRPSLISWMETRRALAITGAVTEPCRVVEVDEGL